MARPSTSPISASSGTDHFVAGAAAPRRGDYSVARQPEQTGKVFITRRPFRSGERAQSPTHGCSESFNTSPSRISIASASSSSVVIPGSRFPLSIKEMPGRETPLSLANRYFDQANSSRLSISRSTICRTVSRCLSIFPIPHANRIETRARSFQMFRIAVSLGLRYHII